MDLRKWRNNVLEREKFSSRLGFILISAGCAIGLGNVWRFPYIVGQYGGAAFVLVYLFFLVIMGLPIMVMEFSVGRASQKSILCSFQELEPKGTKWHWYGWFGMAGNYLLMMYYTTIAGWLILYFIKMLKGDFVGLDTAGVSAEFGAVTADPVLQTIFVAVVVVLGMLVCSRGLKNGVEKINKAMMLCLLFLLVVLAIRAVTLPGAAAGLEFYLKPNFQNLLYDAKGNFRLGEAIYAAMGQAFFTLSLGIGAMAIFGSYIGRERSLMGEVINITILDTFVAFVSGLIIFPSAFAFGVQPDSGPNLIFVTLPNIFNEMPGGRVWGALFFVFMSFAAMSTVTAVFENIISCWMDK
ncbi:sodium-dependent transporter, partial [Intestinimonas timonensis]|uniref:sodium-dependent transporter n=1 Tax=Intestinimonas timonensis TaxID=1689270 RepID=UPI003A938455